MMRSTFLSAILFLSLPVAACKADQCIQQPASISSTDSDKYVGLALALEKLPIDGDLKVQFKNKSTTAYQELSEKNTALYLLLQAILCYRKQGADDGTIAELRAIVRNLMVPDQAGTAKGPTSSELAVIRNGGGNPETTLELFQRVLGL